MRGEFEKLPNISLAMPYARFDIKSNEYISTDPRFHGYALGVINGAWYAFQEQQKKIDSIKKMIVSLRNEFDYGLTTQNLLMLLRVRLKI